MVGSGPPQPRVGRLSVSGNSDPVIGDCRFCGTPNIPLQDSHIMPKWAYRRARDFSGAHRCRDPIRIEDGVALQTSTQMKEHMLCFDCEQRFCRDEDYVARLAFQEDQTLGLTKFIREEEVLSRGLLILGGVRCRAVPISHLDCQAIARFAASVFWRAHAAQRHRIESLRLWKEQVEALRLFAWGKRRLPDGMCLGLLVPVDGAFTFTGVMSGVLFTPTTSKRGENGFHQFMAGGLVFVLTTGTCSTRRLCLACGSASHALIQHWRSMRVLANLGEMIKATEPKGRGARVAVEMAQR